MLKKAKIWVLLDIHALPGVSADHQMFAGQCTDPNFYTKTNFQRGLQLSAVLTALIHADPDWSSEWCFPFHDTKHSLIDWLVVYALQALNEPDQDPSKTPGLDTCNYILY